MGSPSGCTNYKMLPLADTAYAATWILQTSSVYLETGVGFTLFRSSAIISDQCPPKCSTGQDRKLSSWWTTATHNNVWFNLCSKRHFLADKKCNESTFTVLYISSRALLLSRISALGSCDDIRILCWSLLWISSPTSKIRYFRKCATYPGYTVAVDQGRSDLHSQQNPSCMW